MLVVMVSVVVGGCYLDSIVQSSLCCRVEGDWVLVSCR